MPAVRVNQRTVLVNPDLGDAVVGGVGLYARVSSHDQKSDLDRPVARLTAWAADAGAQVVRVETEVGSGMNGRARRCAGCWRTRKSRLWSLNTGIVWGA
ncbi:MAG: putative resolvase [Mycobacterium sp.]|nr:putative resolvase [Mycobacterium sp.]